MPGIGNLIDSVINVLAILFRTPCMINFVLRISRENVMLINIFLTQIIAVVVTVV